MSEMHNEDWPDKTRRTISNKGVTPTVKESMREVIPAPMHKSISQPLDYDEVKGHHGMVAPRATGGRKPEVNREGFTDGEATVCGHGDGE